MNVFSDYLLISLATGKGPFTNYVYKTRYVGGPKMSTTFFPQIFLSLSSWKTNQNEYLLLKFVDSEFEIGETIWWTTPMTNDSDGNAIKYSSWNEVWSLGGFRPNSKNQWIRELLLNVSGGWAFLTAKFLDHIGRRGRVRNCNVFDHHWGREVDKTLIVGYNYYHIYCKVASINWSH